MFRQLFAASVCIVLITEAQQPAIPHLAQAWVAQSSGDGEPGQIGKESYLYEGCKKPSDDCMNAHIFDYGASNCIKVEIDAGFKSDYSGTWLLKCDAVNCCYEGDQNGEPADVKKWDIFHPTGHLDPLRRKVTYLGKHQTTELNGKAVPDADAWNEIDHLPFTKDSVNYTYYVTNNNANQTISHRIDFSGPGADGTILYGDFQVQKNLTAFRKLIQQYVPTECLKPNTLACAGKHSKKWNRKLPRSFSKAFDLSDQPSGFSTNGTCTTDADCPCSYCMNDKTKSPPYMCHPDTPGNCCTTDKDCPGSYCVNYHGPPPYHCHGV